VYAWDRCPNRASDSFGQDCWYQESRSLGVRRPCHTDGPHRAADRAAVESSVEARAAWWLKDVSPWPFGWSWQGSWPFTASASAVAGPSPEAFSAPCHLRRRLETNGTGREAVPSTYDNQDDEPPDDEFRK
jgi:hypothetical protein